MKIPYSHVHIKNDIIFAARGAAIHSFSLTSHAHLSTWKHPDAETQAPGQIFTPDVPAEVEGAGSQGDVDMQAAPDASEPPLKRQRLSADEGDTNTADDGADQTVDKDQSKASRKKGKKAKDRARGEGISHRAPQALDKALVALITTTDDGKHVVAVSGHDKTLWVLEHDGQGVLRQLSQR
jgi:tRNA (guanine-N(7)-)-methyltransferase subunit TRM82